MADKPSKTNRPKARLPRGLADRSPVEVAATRKMLAQIRAVFERYGFEPLETPAIEYTDALGKFLPDQDRPNEGVLFRNEKPGPRRFRQFMQFDADTVGSASPAADAEICMLAADTMEALGIKRGDYVVKVNNRKVIDGVLESIGLGGEENAGKRLTVLRAIDKLDRLGVEGVRRLLGEGRKDESGDFTKGAGLNFAQIESLSQYINWQSIAYVHDEQGRTEIRRDLHTANKEVVERLGTVFGKDKTTGEGLAELFAISELVDSSDYQDRIRIDPSVVRGLEYYTGPVYEVELTLETKDEKGRPVRFGSVGGGGRYDGLVSRFRGEPVPATGF